MSAPALARQAAPAADPGPESPGAMRIVAARDLVPAAPAGLEALEVRVRAPRGDLRRLCAVGDVGPVEHLIPPATGDPFREVAPVLRSADLAFANLEAPLLREVGPGALSKEGERRTRFAAPARAARLLADAGLDLLNLANNHIMDFGAEGLAETRRALSAHGLRTLGAGADDRAARRLEITDLGGLRLGWLGCARTLELQPPAGDVFWEYDPEELVAAVRDARPEVDVLIASIHMGYMFVDYPHPEQRARALELLAAGADLVLIHHAHVLQGIEVTPDGLICHNLGNFLLDWTLGHIRFELMLEEQRTGGIFILDLDRDGVCGLAVLPVRVDDDWTVRWALDADGRTILERLRRISADWHGAGRRFHRQLAERTTGLAFRSTFLELKHGGLRTLPGLLRRIKGHHLRMVAAWPVQKLRRWLRRPAAP